MLLLFSAAVALQLANNIMQYISNTIVLNDGYGHWVMATNLQYRVPPLKMFYNAIYLKL